MKRHASCALLLLPQLPPAELIASIGASLGRRYQRRDELPPTGYRCSVDEWLGIIIGQLDESQLTYLIPSEIGEVFHTALRLSRTLPTAVLAWRQERGLPPVMKCFHDGKPQWKQGDDPDHEVDWHIPARPAPQLRDEAQWFPEKPSTIPFLLSDTLRPWLEAVQALHEGERQVGWVRADSVLAP